MVADQQRTALGWNVVWAEHSRAVADAREEPEEEPEKHRFHVATFHSVWIVSLMGKWGFGAVRFKREDETR